MKFVAALPVLAALALTASSAFAQEAPPPDRSADMAKHHSEMCANHYARAAGKLTEIEVRLNLTTNQKAPFERWKQVKLTEAKAQSTHCADFTPPGRDAPIMELRDRQIAQLQARLDSLKGEQASLGALVKVLTPDQQNELKRVALEIRGERMLMMHRFQEMRGGMGHHMEMRNHPPVN